MPRLRIALATVLLLAIAGQALAQFGGGRRGGTNGPGEGGARKATDSERPPTTRMSTSDQMQMQLNNVRLALKLTPGQNPLWQAYEDRVADLLSDLSRSANPPPEENALRQIDRKVDTARNRLAAMEELSDAAKRLYTSLSGEQKETADRMLPGTVPALYSGQPVSPRGERAR